MNKKFFSYENTKKAINKLAKLIKKSRRKYSGIYGVPKGGIPVALMLSNILKLPILDNCKNSSILVVDEIIDSGKTRKKYPDNDFACIHQRSNINIATYFVEHTDDWIIYWWEGDEKNSIKDSIIRQLQFIGEDIKRDGLIDTPSRVIESWKELYSGYSKNPKDIFKVFDMQGYSEIVLLKDIEFYSVCEHHLLPFTGKAHIAYIPKDKVIGISKLARLLEVKNEKENQKNNK